MSISLYDDNFFPRMSILIRITLTILSEDDIMTTIYLMDLPPYLPPTYIYLLGKVPTGQNQG